MRSSSAYGPTSRAVRRYALRMVGTDHFIEVQPVLHSKDVSKAVAFYVEKLGFKNIFQDSEQDPRYAAVKRGGVELHLQWHDPAEWEFEVDRPNLRFVIDGIDGLYEEYSKQSVFHDRTKMRETEWGTREFAIYDPDGNGLTFYVSL